jgi:hypothetical protein
MNEYKALMLDAFNKYLKAEQSGHATPLFSYDIVESVRSADLRPFDAEHLASDFCDVINQYHAWSLRLNSWAKWNGILKGYQNQDQQAWMIRSSFLEPVAFFCLHQPASFKDLLIKYCTMAFHLANLSRDPFYPDELAEDNEIFKRLQKNDANAHKYFLSRRAALKQLEEISSKWAIGAQIIQLISDLDDADYGDKSQGWRNHSAHYIAPRLHFGGTRPVKRQVHFAESWIKQGDGTISISEDRNKKAISYSFGHTEPLNAEAIYQANAQQLKCAELALIAVHELLNDIVASTTANNHTLSEDMAVCTFEESTPLGREFGAPHP